MLCSPLIHPLIQVQWASPVGGRTNRCGDDSNFKHIAIRVMSMAQIDDFFMYENRVEGITDADYQRAKPYVEAAQAFAQTTYQHIYIGSQRIVSKLGDLDAYGSDPRRIPYAGSEADAVSIDYTRPSMPASSRSSRTTMPPLTCPTTVRTTTTMWMAMLLS